MKLILLNNHEALLTDDKRPVVTVVNGGTGVLVVNGERFPMESGKTPNPTLPDLIGHVRVYFEDTRGIRWRAIRPRMVAGVPYTAIDPMTACVRLMELTDRQAREIERLTKELLELRGKIQPDSLGFLNIGGKENEEAL